LWPPVIGATISHGMLEVQDAHRKPLRQIAAEAAKSKIPAFSGSVEEGRICSTLHGQDEKTCFWLENLLTQLGHLLLGEMATEWLRLCIKEGKIMQQKQPRGGVQIISTSWSREDESQDDRIATSEGTVDGISTARHKLVHCSGSHLLENISRVAVSQSLSLSSESSVPITMSLGGVHVSHSRCDVNAPAHHKYPYPTGPSVSSIQAATLQQSGDCNNYWSSSSINSESMGSLKSNAKHGGGPKLDNDDDEFEAISTFSSQTKGDDDSQMSKKKKKRSDRFHGALNNSSMHIINTKHRHKASHTLGITLSSEMSFISPHQLRQYAEAFAENLEQCVEADELLHTR